MKYATLGATLFVTIGMLGFGYFSFPSLRSQRDLIEVKGLSEKIVDSDIAEIRLSVSNNNEDLHTIYNKKEKEREKIINCLKQLKFDSDIYKSDFSVYEQDNRIYEDGKIIRVEKNFHSTNDIYLRTSQFDKIDALKSELSKLGAEGIFVSIDCVYKLTNFKSLRLDMLSEASKNAQESANAFVKNYNEKVTKLVYLRQGEITISSDVESADSSNSYSPILLDAVTSISGLDFTSNIGFATSISETNIMSVILFPILQPAKNNIIIIKTIIIKFIFLVFIFPFSLFSTFVILNKFFIFAPFNSFEFFSLFLFDFLFIVLYILSVLIFLFFIDLSFLLFLLFKQIFTSYITHF